MRLGDRPLSQAEAQFAAHDLSEFETQDPQADATVMPGQLLDAGKGGDFAPVPRTIGLGPAAAFQTRIEIAVVVRIDALNAAILRVGEKLEARGGRIQAE